MASFRLRDTLPPTLKNLTFYGDEGLLRNESLGDQICEVLESSDFIQLTSILLEDVSHLNRYYTPPNQLPYWKVKRACRERMVSYQEVEGKALLKGGSQLPCFRKAFKMRREREDKWWKEQRLRWTREEGTESSEGDGVNSDGLGFEWLDSEGFDPGDWDSEELDSEELDSENLYSEELTEGEESEELDLED
jgi:hypothetical protein